MSEKNPHLDRQLITYPHPKYHKLFVAECHASFRGKSDLLKKIIRSYYDAMSSSNKEGLMQIYDKMTPEQIKRPGKDKY